MSKILITGSMGFVGRAVIDRLAGAGHHITVLARDEKPAESRLALLKAGMLEEGTLHFDAIIHLAGLAHISGRRAKRLGLSFSAANDELTRSPTGFASRNRIATFINLSSVAVLTGAANKGTIDDDTVPEPTNDYGRSKLGAERHVAALAEEGLSAISLRAPLVVGGNAKGNWKRLMWLAATSLPLPFAGLNNQRSIVSIGSLSDRIAHLANSRCLAGMSGDYCVADIPPLSIAEIVAILRRRWEKLHVFISFRALYLP